MCHWVKDVFSSDAAHLATKCPRHVKSLRIVACQQSAARRSALSRVVALNKVPASHRFALFQSNNMRATTCDKAERRALGVTQRATTCPWRATSRPLSEGWCLCVMPTRDAYVWCLSVMPMCECICLWCLCVDACVCSHKRALQTKVNTLDRHTDITLQTHTHDTQHTSYTTHITLQTHTLDRHTDITLQTHTHDTQDTSYTTHITLQTKVPLSSATQWATTCTWRAATCITEQRRALVWCLMPLSAHMRPRRALVTKGNSKKQRQKAKTKSNSKKFKKI